MSRQKPNEQPHGAAAFEERAELLDLRDQAERTAAEAGQTLTKLVGRLDLTGQPGILARRLAADARHAGVRALRKALGRATGQRGLRIALATIPALAVAAAVALLVARQRAQSER